jgi:ATP-dependent Clp protease ATP-binding subunit ClpC
MWASFSVKARQVIFYAQQEATQQKVAYLDPLHILLGILRDEACNGVKILSHCRISPAEIILVARKEMPLGKQEHLAEMTLTVTAKMVIDHAIKTRRELRSSQLCTEHLLIGLMLTGGCPPKRILSELGLTLTAIDLAIKELPDLDKELRE